MIPAFLFNGWLLVVGGLLLLLLLWLLMLLLLLLVLRVDWASGKSPAPAAFGRAHLRPVGCLW
jgi:hypothetical protein